MDNNGIIALSKDSKAMILSSILKQTSFTFLRDNQQLLQKKNRNKISAHTSLILHFSIRIRIRFMIRVRFRVRIKVKNRIRMVPVGLFRIRV